MDRAAEQTAPGPTAAGPAAPGTAGPAVPAGPAPTRPRLRTRALAWAAGPLLSVPAAVTACRTAWTDAVTPVPQLLSALPWLTVPAGLALLLAAAARRRGLALLAATVLIATAWASLPYTPPGGAVHGTPVARIRVLAANVEYGAAAPAVIDLARRERPHLLYVSECGPSCARTLDAALSRQLPYRVSVDAPGAGGSVLLSAHPLRDRSAVPAAMGMPGATADIAGRAVRVQLAHPAPPVPGQVGRWKAELARLGDALPDGLPAIVAGDFNASQDHAAFRTLLSRHFLRDAARVTGASRTPTWPTEGPLPPYVQIDHVLATPDVLTPVATRFLPLPGSDHRAVLADLDLHDGR